MSTASAPQITKEQWSAIFKEAYTLFEARLQPYKLEKPAAIFNLLVNFASQVGTMEPNATSVYEAVYAQLKAHLLDRTSVGQQRQLEGRPPQPSDLVIRWLPGSEPPAVSKWFPKVRASWIDEVDAREKEAEEHAQYLEARKLYEQARVQCPDVIAQFQPTKNGRVNHSAIERVTSKLQQYLDGYEQQHQEDLQKFEADRTFRGWRVNWPSVLEKMREFANQEYDKAEGRTKEAERL